MHGPTTECSGPLRQRGRSDWPAAAAVWCDGLLITADERDAPQGHCKTVFARPPCSMGDEGLEGSVDRLLSGVASPRLGQGFPAFHTKSCMGEQQHQPTSSPPNQSKASGAEACTLGRPGRCSSLRGPHASR